MDTPPSSPVTMKLSSVIEHIESAAEAALGLTLSHGYRLSLFASSDQLIAECDAVYRRIFGHGITDGDRYHLTQFRGTWIPACPGEIMLRGRDLTRGPESDIDFEMTVALVHEMSHLFVVGGESAALPESARSFMLYTRESDAPWFDRPIDEWKNRWAAHYLPAQKMENGRYQISLVDNESITHFVTQILVCEIAEQMDPEAGRALLAEFADYSKSIVNSAYQRIDRDLMAVGINPDELLSDRTKRHAVGRLVGRRLVTDFPGDRLPSHGHDYPSHLVAAIRDGLAR